MKRSQPLGPAELTPAWGSAGAATLLSCPGCFPTFWMDPLGAGSCVDKEALVDGDETPECRRVEEEPVSSKRQPNLH